MQTNNRSIKNFFVTQIFIHKYGNAEIPINQMDILYTKSSSKIHNK